MTVASRVIQTIGTLKGVQATVEKMAIQTQDSLAKERYLQAVIQLNKTLNALDQRLETMRREEPEYR